MSDDFELDDATIDRILASRTPEEKKMFYGIIDRALQRVKDKMARKATKKRNKKLLATPIIKNKTFSKTHSVPVSLKSVKMNNKTKTKGLKSVTRTPSVKVSKSLKSGTKSLPYHIAMESNEYEASYHANDKCGSNFYGLATTLQGHINSGNINKAIEQVKRCIKIRKRYTRVLGSDKLHEEMIDVLSTLLSDLKMIQHEPDLSNVMVHYDKPANMFIIR